MTYYEQQICPVCGKELLHDDRSDLQWECRHCGQLNRVSEVVV